MRKLQTLIFVAQIITSCTTTKRYSAYLLNENDTIYKNEVTGINQDRKIVEYKHEKEAKKVKIQIKEESDHLKITVLGDPDNLLDDATVLSDTSGTPIWKKIDPSKTYFYFPADTLPKDNRLRLDSSRTNNEVHSIYLASPKIHYSQVSPVFQTMTMPFKFRPSVNDTIPRSITTNVNVGFGFGFKRTNYTHQYHYYKQDLKSKEQFLSSKQKAISFSAGGTVGLSVISLENGKTVTRQVTIDHSETAVSSGLFGVLGVGKFSVGLAFGGDFPIGQDGNKWIYSGNKKWWTGFIVALEFVK